MEHKHSLIQQHSHTTHSHTQNRVDRNYSTVASLSSSSITIDTSSIGFALFLLGCLFGCLVCSFLSCVLVCRLLLLHQTKSLSYEIMSAAKKPAKNGEKVIILGDFVSSWAFKFVFEEGTQDRIINEFTKQIIIKKGGGDLILLQNILSFKVDNDIVDFRKYGETLTSTMTFLQFPINYQVVVEFQKNSYKIKVMNIRATTNESNTGFSTFDILITRKQRSIFAKSKLIQRNLNLLNSYFIDKFSLK